MDKEQRNPFHGLVDSITEWNRMRELGSGKIGSETGHEERPRTHATAWLPSTDVFAKGGNLVIRVSLSGVSPEDVEITLSNDVLTVSGERRSELEDEEEETFYVRERYYGAFRRSWTLPAGVNEDDISADFENGLLELTVRGGAATAPEPRRIEIGGRHG
ncbi:MAG: Hsp20/alpha crystallin family protein [Actinomycetota bacterium]|jgi:HSP20 family protein|nr:Hsp20/alpha crystallin family protein [Rubrobacteraceae bacterium]MDQ3498665.1 Hsp20/alpha crystallin family protein [Actinomycetota bacterium]